MTNELLDAMQAIALLALLAALAGLAMLWASTGGPTRLSAWALRQQAGAEAYRLRAERLAREVMSARAQRDAEDRMVAARALALDLRRQLAEAEAAWSSLDPAGAQAAGVGRLRVVGGGG